MPQPKKHEPLINLITMGKNNLKGGGGVIEMHNLYPCDFLHLALVWGSSIKITMGAKGKPKIKLNIW